MVSYTVPTESGAAPIRDLVGNDAMDIEDRAARNNTSAPDGG